MTNCRLTSSIMNVIDTKHVSIPLQIKGFLIKVRYGKSFWPIDSEALLSMRVILNVLQYTILVMVIVFTAGTPVKGQGTSVCPVYSPTPFQGLSDVPSVVEREIPGSTDPRNPYLFPPYVSAEVRITPVFQNMLNGTLEVPAGGARYDLVNPLGFVDQAIFVEFMGRFQVSRFSARIIYDAYLRTLRGSVANLTWPDARVGADIDLYSAPNLRLGINGDFMWEQPKFSYAFPEAGHNYIRWPRPSTFGVHAVWKPYACGKISSVVELRYRRPLRSGSRVTEFEVGAGFLLPETSTMGTFGFRAGWRYTTIELDTPDAKVDLTLSGFFGEYVFYY